MHPEERTDSRINFIKRLVGLPGDTIRIQNGDVWIKTAKDKKNLATRRSLSSPASRRESCWRCFSRCSTTTTCRELPKTAGRRVGTRRAAGGRRRATWHSDDLRDRFRIDGSAKRRNGCDTIIWCRPYDMATRRGRQPPTPQPQLITDFTAYDTGKMRMYADPRRPGPNGPGIGTHWVGDLAVECVVETERPGGNARS